MSTIIQITKRTPAGVWNKIHLTRGQTANHSAAASTKYREANFAKELRATYSARCRRSQQSISQKELCRCVIISRSPRIQPRLNRVTRLISTAFSPGVDSAGYAPRPGCRRRSNGSRLRWMKRKKREFTLSASPLRPASVYLQPPRR